MLDLLLDWIPNKEVFIGWAIVTSIVMFAGSLVVLPILIVRMPADYFLHKEPPPDSWRGQHAVVRWTVLVIKNLVGALLLLAGFVMIFTPGQGVLAILVGISLLNVPGKRRLELKLIRNRPVYNAISWVRSKYHRPPLQLPPRSSHGRD